jgi:hypothetical protein
MQFQGYAIATRDGNSGIHGATGIDDQHIACLQKAGNIAELAVHDTISAVVGDHKPHFIPGQSASFRWFTGF